MVISLQPKLPSVNQGFMPTLLDEEIRNLHFQQCSLVFFAYPLVCYLSYKCEHTSTDVSSHTYLTSLLISSTFDIWTVLARNNDPGLTDTQTWWRNHFSQQPGDPQPKQALILRQIPHLLHNKSGPLAIVWHALTSGRYRRIYITWHIIIGLTWSQAARVGQHVCQATVRLLESKALSLTMYQHLLEHLQKVLWARTLLQIMNNQSQPGKDTYLYMRHYSH